MADVLLFMQHGWKNIWKQNTVWVFSALPFLDQVFRVFVPRPDSKSIWLLPYLAESLLAIVLFFVSFIGVPYLVYCFYVEKQVSVQETLSAVKKFTWRVLGCSCLSILFLSPFIFLVVAFSLNTSTQPPQLSNKAVFLFLPLALFTGTWDFTMFEFFSSDKGIRKSLKNAWMLFTAHFSTLAMLGLIMALVFRLYTISSGILTVLIQFGLDLPALSEFNYINPSAALSKNFLFILVNGIGQVIFTPFSVSAFVLAYLKYNGVKTSMLPSQK